MKAGTSSLNPYAAAYIPLSRRVSAKEDKSYKLAEKGYMTGNETGALGHYFDRITHNQQQTLEEYTPKGKTTYDSYGSTSQSAKDMVEKQIMDEEVDMDLVYLQMTFPGISEESLSEVYLANKGDLELTLDMLRQLELYTGDSSGHLPDTLDIGDVAEPGSSSESASLSVKKAAEEIAGGSSGSSESMHVT